MGQEVIRMKTKHILPCLYLDHILHPFLKDASSSQAEIMSKLQPPDNQPWFRSVDHKQLGLSEEEYLILMFADGNKRVVADFILV